MMLAMPTPGKMVTLLGHRTLMGLAGDRTAAASYCGQKYGVTSPDFQPCVDWYANDKAGDYPGPKPPVPPLPTPSLPGSTPGTIPPIIATAATQTMWSSIPMWVKIAGAAVLAFAGYKLFTGSARKAA